MLSLIRPGGDLWDVSTSFLCTGDQESRVCVSIHTSALIARRPLQPISANYISAKDAQLVSAEAAGNQQPLSLTQYKKEVEGTCCSLDCETLCMVRKWRRQ